MMIKKIRNMLVVFCFGVAPLTAHAVLIDPGTGYTRDSASNIVIGGGLEWLKWDETTGLSINSALATYASAGWHVATNTNMAALFNAFNFGLTFDALENTQQEINHPWTPTEDNLERDFINLFGVTQLVGSPIYLDSDPVYRSAAFYGTDPDNDTLINMAQVLDDFTVIGTGLQSGTRVVMHGEFWTADAADPILGVALVRTVGFVPVPEPGTIALFLLGILGLRLTRRRLRKTQQVI